MTDNDKATKCHQWQCLTKHCCTIQRDIAMLASLSWLVLMYRI